MKVGIITLYGNINYGNRLQNYALYKVLNKYGIQAVTIVINNSEDENFNIIKMIKKFLKLFLKKKNNQITFRKINEYKREGSISQFTKKYIPTIILNSNNIRDINALQSEYDFFVVGSDQVWNPFVMYNGGLEKYFLKFAPKNKRIAYSASFGINNVPNELNKEFFEGLSGMQAISVREERGKDIVKKLIGIDVPVLLDPTMLLTSDEWSKIELTPEWYHGEEYILSYFLGDMPSTITEIAKKYNYRIYNLMDENNANLYTSRVEEFIYLIHHSKLVCTDSFHACVFSILFNVPFIAVKRSGNIDMTSRLFSLMDYFGYRNRICDFNNVHLNENQIMHMNFSNVDEVLNRERRKAKEYLSKSMGVYKD